MQLAPIPWVSPVVYLLLFAILWIGVIWLLSHLTGWVALAKIYRAPTAAAGIPVRLRSVHLGSGLLGQYRNVLTAWVSGEGLQLRMLFLFRVNTPDLFFPWSDVSVSRGRQLFFDYVELKFRLTPDIPLRIYGKAAEQLREVAAEHWPERMAPAV